MIWLLGCLTEANITGIARDELRLRPLPEVLLVPATPSERCPPARVEPSSDFRFSARVCSGMDYTVSWAPGGTITWRGTPEKARAGQHVDIHAWPGAPEPGYYLLDDGLRRLTSTPVETAVAPGGTPVAYPLAVPADLPAMPATGFLLAQGAPLRVVSLGRSSEPLPFERAGQRAEMAPWRFLGADLANTGPIPLPQPQVGDPVSVTGLSIHYVYAGLLPPGDWAVYPEGSSTAWLFTVPAPS